MSIAAGPRGAGRIGVVGLGVMGMGMARNLARAGLDVSAFDLRPEARREAEGFGVGTTDSLGQLASGADIVFVVVLTLGQVEDVLFGAAGIAASMRAGSVVVVCSTIGPAIRGLAGRCDELGIHLVDCPITGGRAGADSGGLTLIVSGAAEAISTCQTAFEAISATMFVVGDQTGLGQAAKAAVQSIVTAVAVAAAEGVAIATAAGVQPALMAQVLQASVVQSPFLKTAVDNIVAERFAGTGTPLALMNKDIAIVAQTAALAGVAAPLAGAMGDILGRALKQFEGEDIWSLVKLGPDA